MKLILMWMYKLKLNLYCFTFKGIFSMVYFTLGILFAPSLYLIRHYIICSIWYKLVCAFSVNMVMRVGPCFWFMMPFAVLIIRNWQVSEASLSRRAIFVPDLVLDRSRTREMPIYMFEICVRVFFYHLSTGPTKLKQDNQLSNICTFDFIDFPCLEAWI